MNTIHFKSQKDRLDYIKGKFTEIEPKKVEIEEIIPQIAEEKTEEKPKKAKKSAKKSKKEDKDGKVQAE